MAENSKIQWTHHTFNPWVGCVKVSAGCTNCYAEAYDRRVGGVPKTQRDPNKGEPQLRWGKGSPRTRTSASYWRQPLRWNGMAAALGERHRVFCASLADVFENGGNLDVWRVELFDIIRRTPSLDWLLLTKRPEHIRHALSSAVDAFALAPDASMETVDMLGAWGSGNPPPNVWLGTTVENQEQAEKRIPHLLGVPAVVRFLSCEPLLGPVNIARWVGPMGPNSVDGFGVDWVIIGGESGAKARPFHVEWARSLVGQCRDAGVVPFVKQMGAQPFEQPRPEPIDHDGEPRRIVLKDSHGGDWNEWPSDLRVREFPR